MPGKERERETSSGIALEKRADEWEGREDWPLAGESPFCLSWELEGMVQMATWCSWTAGVLIVGIRECSCLRASLSLFLKNKG